MENQVNFAAVSGANHGEMSAPPPTLPTLALSPLLQPPPCTRIATGNGPSPSGTFASSFKLVPPACAYSTSRCRPGSMARAKTHAPKSKLTPSSLIPCLVGGILYPDSYAAPPSCRGIKPLPQETRDSPRPFITCHSM